MEVGGWEVTTSCEAAAGTTLNGLVVTAGSPLVDAWSV